MDDFYTEQLIKKQADSKDTLKKVGLIALTVVSVLLVFVIPVGIILPVVMIVIDVLMFRNLNVEYEYLLVDKIFSVDLILNKMRRKKAAEYTLEDIQVIAPENSGRIREYDNQVKKVSDYTSGDAGAVRYAFIYTKSGAGEKVLFEPDDKMLRCIKQMAPRKMFEN